ncbi:MAG TPA: HAMP domain-containing sensor histidine kinase [Burkholderiaceae bacterium]|jgi:signal transduction histidine kinase
MTPNARMPTTRRWRRSLGARLVGLFVLLALGMIVTFMIGMQSALRFGWQDYARPLVADYVDTLTAQIGTPPDVARAQALAARLPLRIRIEGPVVNWSSQPGTRWPAPRDDDRGHPHPDTWRPVRTLSDGHRITFGLVNPLRDDAPEDRPRLIGWATLATLLLLTALAYAAVRRLLRPLADIRAGALRYGAGDFTRPIAPRRNDELGELAAQINRMADGLHGMLDAKRALLLAISHELRSPLTRARLNAELVEEGAARDGLLRDLAEMRDLIHDLLESERLAAGHAALHIEMTDVNALIHEVIETALGGRPVETALAPMLPPWPLDRTRIRLLLRNLLDNALRHSARRPPGIATRLEGDTLRIVVRDHGPGVSEAELAHLTEAFYRTDAARSRSTGGVGLGLHLCALIAQAHGGALALRNADPGFEATLTLPHRAAAGAAPAATSA